MDAPSCGPILRGRSDALAEYRDYSLPAFRDAVGPLDHFALVIDTNRVLEELGWLAAKRKRPEARTGLQELHASGTVSLFAPEVLVEEAESHFDEVAKWYLTSADALRAAWDEYRPMIHLVPSEHLGPPDPLARDPKDVPFLRAKEAVGADAIISKDKDIRAMAGLMVAHETIRIAVDYARAATVRAEGRLMLTGAVAGAIGVVWGAGAGTLAAGRGFMRLPRWLKIAIPAALLLALLGVALHPAPRRKLRDAVQTLKAKWPRFKDDAGAIVEQFSQELRTAEVTASTALEIVRQQIPSRRKGPTIRQYAYRACLVAEGPISLAHLEMKIRRLGYSTDSRQLAAYVLRVLRGDPRFHERAEGWDLTARVRRDSRLIEVRADAVTQLQV